VYVVLERETPFVDVEIEIRDVCRKVVEASGSSECARTSSL